MKNEEAKIVNKQNQEESFEFEFESNTNMKSKSKMSISQKTFKSMKVVEQSLKNKCFFVGLILTSALLFVTQLGFNALAGNPDLIKGGPFHNSIGNISRLYPLSITPAGWAFSIWGIIYLLQFGSTLYSLAMLCRTTDDGQPVYTSPAVLSPLYFILFNLSCILNVGWLFQWDRLFFTASLVFLASTALVLFSALSIASTRLVFYESELINSGRRLDVNVIRIVVINGLGIYATWTSIATLINLGTAMLYRWNLGLVDETVSVICLGLLFGLVVIYSTLDLTIFDRYTRYTFTPYATVIWALSAIINKNWNSDNYSSIFSAVLLGASSVLFIVKSALVMYRANRVANPYRRLNIGGPIKLADEMKT